MGRVGILDAVVQQGGDEGICIQSNLCDNLRHGQGVDDIRGAVLADLIGVLIGSIIHCLVDELHIHIWRIPGDGPDHGVIPLLERFHVCPPVCSAPGCG